MLTVNMGFLLVCLAGLVAGLQRQRGEVGPDVSLLARGWAVMGVSVILYALA